MRYSEETIHRLEFNRNEIELLENTLKKINGILLENKIDLTDNEQNVLDDIIYCVDEILHP